MAKKKRTEKGRLHRKPGKTSESHDQTVGDRRFTSNHNPQTGLGLEVSLVLSCLGSNRQTVKSDARIWKWVTRIQARGHTPGACLTALTDNMTMMTGTTKEKGGPLGREPGLIHQVEK